MSGEEYEPMPTPVARCKRCQSVASVSRWLKWPTEPMLVSAAGVEHLGDESGMTQCGIDATRDGWMWAL